jgi:hypothetical protein
MQEGLVALTIFVCLVAASLGSLVIHPRLPPRHQQDDVLAVVRSIASFFGIMTSLLLGLTINSSKNTLEQVDRNLRTWAADLIVLDRTLRRYGPGANEVRQHLLRYTQRAALTRHDDSLIADRATERLLNDVMDSFKQLQPRDDEQQLLWRSAQQQLDKIVELRWIILGQSEGTIPTPIVVLLVGWLMLIFASFGYQAPRNLIVVASLVLASLLVAGGLYLILDMDSPFDGPIRVSSLPLDRAVAEMRH